MALMALASSDAEISSRVTGALDRSLHDLLVSPSWDAIRRLVRERPVSLLLLDVRRYPPGGPSGLLGLRRAFPSLPVLALAPEADPLLLFELGRARVSDLSLLTVDGSALELRRTIAGAVSSSAPGRVVRSFGGVLEGEALRTLRAALELTHRCWSADRFAHARGLSRPALSAHLRSVGLPPVGHLLLWARLLHAGHWLPDPGRSGESVSRQLEYANGAVFRRALRNFVGATPTEVAERGGLAVVLRAFASHHGLPHDGRRAVSVA